MPNQIRRLLDKIPVGYLSMDSEPADEGAPSRTVEQSSKARPASEVKVLDFLTDHQDELISYDEISRGSDVSTQSVGRIVRKLEQEGLVVRSDPIPRHGTRYIIRESTSSRPADKEAALYFSTQDSKLSNVKSTILQAREFIRETRSNSTQKFVQWLKRKGSNE